MITENEIRSGNILNYQAAEGDILQCTIDWQDIKWCVEDPKGFNIAHSPVPLTEMCQAAIETAKKVGRLFRQTRVIASIN